MATHSGTLAWNIPWTRCLVGYSPWCHEESDATEQLHFHFSLSCIGEGNGNPLHCSCLQNPSPGGLPSMRSHRVGHDWGDLAAAAAAACGWYSLCVFFLQYLVIYLAVPGLSCGVWDLVPWPGLEPGPSALGVWSLSHTPGPAGKSPHVFIASSFCRFLHWNFPFYKVTAPIALEPNSWWSQPNSVISKDAISE